MTKTVIDVHAHLVPQSFPELPEGVPSDGWPTMEPVADGSGSRMMINGKEFRFFENFYWDVPGRIAEMDAENVTMQVLSPLPELMSYWFDARTAAEIARHMNKTIGDIVKASPDRFAGLGTLPLQDVALSISMLDELQEQGLRGILCASNVNGTSIADQSFFPLFAEFEKRGLVLFVHGYRPAGTDRMLGSPMMGAIIGVPQEGMAAVASFIMVDIFKHFPKLKLGFVHGGGTFGAVIERFNHVWKEFPQLRAIVPIEPKEYVRRFFFDTVTFGEPYLRYLVEAYGPDVLMAGTDGPTAIGQKELEKFVTSACKGDEVAADKILWQNAARFLGLEKVGNETVPA